MKPIHPELDRILKAHMLPANAYKTGLERIEAMYGFKYEDFKSTWMYRHVCFLGEESWLHFCEELAPRFDRLPTPNQILAILAPKIIQAKEARMNAIQAWYKAQGRANCPYCDHTGLLEAKSLKTEIYPSQGHSFRCPFCEFSTLRSLSTTIPRWAPSLEGMFYIKNRRPMDEKDKMWRDIYRHGGKLQGIRRAFKEGPEKVWNELFQNGLK